MIDELPAAPDPANDLPADFSKKAAALVLAQKAMVPQINTAIANFNAAFSGNAYAIPYTIDLSGTSDIDPGNGKLRFDNATQNLATTLRLDLLGAGTPAVDYTAMIDTFDSSTSTVKGHIRIVKLGDASKFLLFSVSARTALTGYRDISVAPVASSSANPFVAGDGVLLFFQRTGDKGDKGDTGSISLPIFHVREEGGPAAATNIATGIERRVLNTVKNNDISGASLASNQVTVPPGKYRMRVYAILDLQGSTNFIGHHKVAVYNVTDGTYAVMGQSRNMASISGGLYAWGIASLGEGVVTISTSKVFEVRSIHSDSIAGYGQAVGSITPEVFTELILEKIG
jgi:hypothetical protein